MCLKFMYLWLQCLSRAIFWAFADLWLKLISEFLCLYVAEDVIEDEGIDTGEGISNHSNKTSDVETEEVEASLKHVSSDGHWYMG